MERSRNVVFVSHCILNQNVLPKNLERFSGAFKEILSLLTEHGVGIIQLPCPEFEFLGLNRDFRIKRNFTNKYREKCSLFADSIIDQIRKYLQNNYRVLAIIGVDSSPSCAPMKINNGKRDVLGKGIFVEEIENKMQKEKFQIPIIGISFGSQIESINKIQKLLKYSDF